MKIFVDGYLLNKEYQGTRTYITELYKELALIKPDYKIVFGVDEISDEILREFAKYSNISFYTFKQKNKWIRMFTEYAELSVHYDYMHFQYIIPFRKVNKKCKYINTIHDVLFIDFPSLFPTFYRISRHVLFFISAKRADLLLTVSNYSKERIVKHFSVPASKVKITPNGVNEIFLENYNPNEVRKEIKQKYNIEDYILYVSRIEPRKNQEKLLELYSNNEEVNSKYNLVFIGKKSLESATFNQLYLKLSSTLKDKIYYIDQVNNEDLHKIYKAASFFVYPSLYEGFGIPPIEAAASQIPVLCHNNTAMSDFTFIQRNLIDFNSDEINELFLAFIRDTHAELESQKEYVKNNYTWKISAQYLDGYL